jgi:hypothetical protein
MLLLAQTGPTSYLFLAVLALTIFIMLVRVQKYYGRPRSRRPSFESPPEKPAKQSYGQGSPDSMVRWEVQMHETARQLSARLDSKMGALEQLVREADRSAARLEAALTAARAETGRAAIACPHSEAAAAAADESSEFPPVNQAEALRPAVAVNAKLQTELHGDMTSAARPPVDRRYEEIYTLADYGLDTAEIAHRVGSPVGEVDLILSLRAKRS